MTQTEQPGPSFVRFEPPDISFWAFIGDISEAEMRRLLEEHRSFAVGRDYTLALVDLSRTGAVDPRAPVLCTEPPSFVNVLGAAVFGASFRHRVIAQFIAMAGNVIARERASPIRFFGTEQEARVWLDEHRLVLQKSRRS
jgi:hypothetical protein